MQASRLSAALGALFLVIGVAATSHLVAQGTNGNSNPSIGTWKLNVAKSKYDPGPAPKSQTNAIEAMGTDRVKVTVEGVAGDGSRMAYSYTAKYDGMDTPYAPGSVGAVLRSDCRAASPRHAEGA